MATGESGVIIGGYEPTANKYVWIDGSKWAYTNWDSGQPGGGSEHCAVLYPRNEKWHDHGCDEDLRSRSFDYVCETKATPACVAVDIDFRGNDIGYLGNIGSWEDCNCECKKKAGCTHFTWHAYSSGQCYLKNGRNPVYKKGDLSASVECSDKCSNGCQADWERYGSSCLRAFSNKVTWKKAQAACQMENGNLASIVGSITKNGVENLIEKIPNTDRLWIGLSRPTRGSAWEWVDNTPLTYKVWGKGLSGDGDCPEIITKRHGAYDHGWNDLGCTSNRAYVCKKLAFTSSTCPEMNIDFSGNDLGLIKSIPSLEDCVCECKKRKGCTCVTWTPKEFGHYGFERCQLKSSDAGRKSFQGAFSANIDCVNQC